MPASFQDHTSKSHFTDFCQAACVTGLMSHESAPPTRLAGLAAGRQGEGTHSCFRLFCLLAASRTWRTLALSPLGVVEAVRSDMCSKKSFDDDLLAVNKCHHAIRQWSGANVKPAMGAPY